MAYTTPDQIKKIIKKIATSGQINDDLLLNLIEESESILNSQLSSIYKTPVDAVKSPNSFSLLGVVVNFKVVQRLEMIFKTRTSEKGGENIAIAPLAAYQKEHQKTVNGILSGNVELSDAETLAGITKSNFQPSIYNETPSENW